MNRVFVCGDTHGENDLGKIKRLQQSENKLDMGDYLIICGDAGIVWSKDTLDDSIKLYESFGTNILFVDGNHENFDMLNGYEVTKWNGGDVHRISEHIIHLMRGQVFDICGKIIFTMGGAESWDKENRIEHESWWKEESIGLYDRIATIFLNGLEKYDNKVDYVITHTLPTTAIEKYIKQLTACGEDIPPYLAKKLIQTQSTEALDLIYKHLKFKHWYCGHFHTDDTFDKFTILYSNIVELK